jgi:cytochrome P450
MPAIQTRNARDPIFNPLDPETIRDPYSAYRRLREADPVYWHEQLQSWTLTGYADCQFVLKNPEIFAADFRRIGEPTPAELLSIQTLDPPDHTPLRDFLGNCFRSQHLESLESITRERVEGRLADLAKRPSFDFITELADPLALATITTFLGVEPPANDETFSRLNDELDRSMDSGLAPEAQEAGRRAREHFNALVELWLAGNPDEGMLGYAVAHGHDADLAADVLVNSVRAFFHAGFEVPSRFLGNLVLALISQPGAIDHLRLVDSLDTALDELVRYAGPVHALSRACVQDTDLGGKRIARGDIVVALIGAANRDPLQFNGPDQLVLDRAPNAHLGFGRGVHSCLGFRVGLIQARATIDALVHRYPGLHVVSEPVLRKNATLRGLAHLPVAVAS